MQADFLQDLHNAIAGVFEKLTRLSPAGFKSFLEQSEEFMLHSRIRNKFIVIFLLVSTVPLLLSSWKGIETVNLTHRADIAAIEKNIISQKSAEISRFFNETATMLDYVLAYDVRAAISPADQPFFVENLLAANPSLVEASLIDADGRYPKNPNERTTVVPDGIETFKAYRDGKTEPKLLDVSELPSYKEVLRTGRMYVSPVRFTLRGPMMTVAAPVRNRNGDLVNVVSAELLLSEVTRIAQTKLGTRGYAYIVDTNGNIVAHSTGIDVGRNVLENKRVASILGGTIKSGLDTNDQFTNIWGEEVFGAGERIDALGWALLVEWPVRDAQQIVSTLVDRLITFLLWSAIGVFFVATLVAIRFVQPITVLKKGVEMIGRGNLDYRIKLRTNDEIEELGYFVNRMANELKELEELKTIKLKAQFLARSLAKERELSKTKDQFITVASHQLYTPLSAMRWAVEMLGSDPEEARRGIEASRREMLSLVSDLLTVSEIGFQYRKPDAIQSVDIAALVAGIVESHRAETEEKKISARIEREGDNFAVSCFELHMKNAVDQLIMNAITYSNDGKEIVISVSSDTGHVTLVVKDSGIGVPADDQGSLFKEFFRAKNAVAKKNVGTGLGLFIAKTIVEGHGGSIGFESKENEGSRFWISLPRSAASGFDGLTASAAGTV